MKSNFKNTQSTKVLSRNTFKNESLLSICTNAPVANGENRLFLSKLFLMFFAFSVLIIMLFSLGGCSSLPELPILSEPVIQIDIENNIIQWGKVENATSFRVEFADLFDITMPAVLRSINFSTRLNQIPTGYQTIKVTAVGCGVYFTNSSTATKQFFSTTYIGHFRRFPIMAVDGSWGYSVIWDSHFREEKIIVPYQIDGIGIIGIGVYHFDENEMFGGFTNMPSLREVVLPTSLQRIGFNAFYGSNVFHDNKDGVYYVSNWAIGIRENTKGLIYVREGTLGIADAAFFQSTINQVVLPDSLRYIGRMAFFHSDLGEGLALGTPAFNIPENVVHIGGRAFWWLPYFDNRPSGPIVVNGWIVAVIGWYDETISLLPEAVGQEVIGIGDYVFGGLFHMRDVIIPITTVFISRAAFWYLFNEVGDSISIRIHIPFSQEEIPSTWHPLWNDFQEIVFRLPQNS
ncbi:MAG: leucine-rich repeat domain-containing protein [Firmicutes bacterium]|nr:leucine-rich repeat domain-containing protein [Bacillota bacterium]